MDRWCFCAILMRPTWVLSAPCWPHVGLMNLAIRDDSIKCRQQAICWINDGKDTYTSLGFVYLIASKHKRWPHTCNIICIINIDFALIYSEIFLFDSHDVIFPLYCHSSTIHCWCIWLMWDKIIVCQHNVFHWWFWNILNKPIENDLQPDANNCFVYGDKRGICNNIPLCYCAVCCIFNSSHPGKYGRHFADDIFRCIFMNEKFCIMIKILRKFVSKGQIYNNPALVQKMAWCRIGNKPLSELMLTQFTDAYMQH